MQPLLVRPVADGTYELIAGERRWRAAQVAGLEQVPAVVREQEDAERLQTALVENMAREDLNPVDEARACATLVEDLGLSKEELARRVGRSRAAVSNLIRLLDLPDDVIDLLRSGELSEGHGRAILQARGVDVRRRLARDGYGAGGRSERLSAAPRGPPASAATRARRVTPIVMRRSPRPSRSSNVRSATTRRCGPSQRRQGGARCSTTSTSCVPSPADFVAAAEPRGATTIEPPGRLAQSVRAPL